MGNLFDQSTENVDHEQTTQTENNDRWWPIHREWNENETDPRWLQEGEQSFQWVSGSEDSSAKAGAHAGQLPKLESRFPKRQVVGNGLKPTVKNLLVDLQQQFGDLHKNLLIGTLIIVLPDSCRTSRFGKNAKQLERDQKTINLHLKMNYCNLYDLKKIESCLKITVNTNIPLNSWSVKKPSSCDSSSREWKSNDQAFGKSTLWSIRNNQTAEFRQRAIFCRFYWRFYTVYGCFFLSRRFQVMQAFDEYHRGTWRSKQASKCCAWNQTTAPST